MKRLIKSCIGTLVMALAITLTAVICSPATVLANEITVEIDGVQVVFEGQEPVIENGRSLVPIRGVFEVLGFDVEW